MNIAPHNLSPASIGRRDAVAAFHGSPISNPYVLGSWQSSEWHDAFVGQFAELETEELLRNAKRTDLEAA